MSAFRRSSSLCSVCAWEQCLRDWIIREGLVWSALCHCNALNFFEAGWLCWVWQLWKPHLPCCSLNSWVYPFNHNGLIHLPLWRSLVWEFHYHVCWGPLNDLSNQSSTRISLKCCLFKFFQSTHWAICIFWRSPQEMKRSISDVLHCVSKPFPEFPYRSQHRSTSSLTQEVSVTAINN